MLRDRTIIWVLEYFFGAALVLLPIAGLYCEQGGLPEAHIWAAELLVICLGVVLISSASSMRQRMILSKRIEQLAAQTTDAPARSKEAAGG